MTCMNLNPYQGHIQTGVTPNPTQAWPQTLIRACRHDPSCLLPVCTRLSAPPPYLPTHPPTLLQNTMACLLHPPTHTCAEHHAPPTPPPVPPPLLQNTMACLLPPPPPVLNTRACLLPPPPLCRTPWPACSPAHPPWSSYRQRPP